MAVKAGMLRYLQEAFLTKWNLLAFSGAVVAGAISPVPDIILPLVLASELAYLAGLTSIPRFQKAIDVKAYAESQKAPGAQDERKSTHSQLVREMVEGLDEERSRRFENLRAHCQKMHDLAKRVRGGQSSEAAQQLGAPGLDRLLWVFLRLLYSSHALERFLDAADEQAMEAKLKEHLATKATKTEEDDRILRSVTDAIATLEMRIENYRKAEGNFEYVNVELDRVEGKIHALTEMGVSSQDPDYISSQVDSVAESMVHTVEAIRELNHITGLSEELGTTPSILDADLVEAS